MFYIFFGYLIGCGLCAIGGVVETFDDVGRLFFWPIYLFKWLFTHAKYVPGLLLRFGAWLRREFLKAIKS